MSRYASAVFVAALGLAYLAGAATAPGLFAQRGPASSLPKWQRIPLSPDQGQPLHWAVEDLKKAHEAMVSNPRTQLRDILSLPITRTHLFSFRHIAPSSGEIHSEQHEGVSELHFVVAGSATASIGGEMANREASETQPGEYRGGAVTGGEVFRVKAGDVVNIPPGAPHTYLADGPEGVSYMIVKINVGLYPWSLVAGATLP